MRKYYEAYDDRYNQVHREGLRWASGTPSAIVSGIMDKFGITPAARILEIGCGEGRDAEYLLKRGYDVLATDISPEAVAFCQRTWPKYAGHFRVLDSIGGVLDEAFDFIYAVAVVHMLVDDGDRNSFYCFIREHLNPGGVALVCTMGDGETERLSDVSTAFELQERIHQESGKILHIAETSCRMVNFSTFEEELKSGGFAVLEQGFTAVEPDFPVMMYAAVKAQ